MKLKTKKKTKKKKSLMTHPNIEKSVKIKKNEKKVKQ